MSNAKKIVEQIKKLAQLPPPPKPPSGYGFGGAPRPPSDGPAPVRTQHGGSAPNAISKMQLELINIANAVKGAIGAGALAAPPGSKTGPLQPGQQSQQAAEEQKEAAGRLAFNNFIAEHYMRQSDVPAVEFDPNPNVTEISKKQPSKATRMNVLMDTMSRIGNPKSESKTDGVWGPRTNAALRNAYSLGYALLKMSQDFHIEPTAYDFSELNVFKGLFRANADEMSPTEKEHNATEITKHLRAIRNLFTEVKEKVFNNPQYRSYIEGTQAYTTYSKDESPSPQLIADLGKKFTNMKVTGVGADNKQKTVPITVNDLASPQAFQLWQQNNLPNMSAEDILNQLKQHLNQTGFPGAAK